MTTILNAQGFYRGTFPEISNRADWICDIEIADADTEEAIDISTATFIVDIQDNSKSSRLRATNTDGNVTFPGGGTDGVFRFEFSAEELGGLFPLTYNIGILMTLDGIRYQLVIATVPIVEGYVS